MVSYHNFTAAPYALGTGGVVFDPASLFASGEEGAWFEPSPSTAFASSTDLTPCGAGDTGGFLLDLSQGAGYSGSEFTGTGSENFPTGDLEDTYSSGTLDYDIAKAAGDFLLKRTDSGQTVSGNIITLAGGNTGFCIVIPSDGPYLVEVAFSSNTAGSVQIAQGSAGTASKSGSSGTVSIYSAFTDDRTGCPYLRTTAPGSVTIDNISVKELPGNRAVQSNSSFRALLQASPDRFVFDGADDRYDTGLNPTTTGSIAVRFKGGTASRVAIGAQGASDGRCYVGLASDGAVAGGVGTQGTSTIKGSTDRRDESVTVVLTWNGTTVTLYENGSEVYSAAQSGAVTTSVPFVLGALNNNGTPAAFWDDDIEKCIVTDDVITAVEAANLHTLWSS